MGFCKQKPGGNLSHLSWISPCNRKVKSATAVRVEISSRQTGIM